MLNEDFIYYVLAELDSEPVKCTEIVKIIFFNYKRNPWSLQNFGENTEEKKIKLKLS